MSYSFVDIEAKEKLYRDVGQLMVERGFLADVPYWRRKNDETIVSLFIENYRGGFLFYISLGVYVVGLGDKKTRRPKLPQMHAWCRLARLIRPTTRCTGEIALSRGGKIDPNNTIDEALEAIRTVGFGILDEFSSLDGTKRVLDHYGEMRLHIGPLLKQKLYGGASVRIRGEMPIQDWEIAGSVNPFHKSK